jgi:hypothetical protein
MPHLLLCGRPYDPNADRLHPQGPSGDARDRAVPDGGHPADILHVRLIMDAAPGRIVLDLDGLCIQIPSRPPGLVPGRHPRFPPLVGDMGLVDHRQIGADIDCGHRPGLSHRPHPGGTESRRHGRTTALCIQKTAAEKEKMRAAQTAVRIFRPPLAAAALTMA